MGTIVLLANVVLLSSYTLGCHSMRHLVGGVKDEISKSSVGQACYNCSTSLNIRHQLFAWISLFMVTRRGHLYPAVRDGIWTDLRPRWWRRIKPTGDVLVVGAGGAGLRRHRGRQRRRQRRPDLQVPARQSAHRDGRRRHGRGHGAQRRSRQLEGALRRHDARRPVCEQLANGRDPRQGGARSCGSSKWGAVFDRTPGRPHQPAELRRPPLSAIGARRRSHRPGTDQDAAGSRSIQA